MKMRLRNKDFLWILPLAAAVILFLNIFIEKNFNSYQVTGRQVYSVLGTAEEKELFNPVTEEEDKSYLPFELLGTIIGKRSLAFIYNSDTDKQGVYRLSGLIEGYKIISILPAKVILGKDGSTRELLLAAHSAGSESVVSEDGSGTLLINKGQLMGQIIRVNEALTKLKVFPLPDNTASNKLRGFLIDNIPSGSIIEEAGIKSGDIIYSVQGKKLQSVQDAWQMFNTIQNQPRFEVVLLRGGKPVTLRYEIRN